jgi:hypothetical protein
MSSSSAAATETPRARAQRLYKSYIDNPVEAFGGKLQAIDNLKGEIRKILLNPYISKIIDVHMKDTDLDLEFVETQIKPEHKDKVYSAIADATLKVYEGGKRKSRKSKSRKSKKSKRKSRKN